MRSPMYDTKCTPHWRRPNPLERRARVGVGLGDDEIVLVDTFRLFDGLLLGVRDSGTEHFLERSANPQTPTAPCEIQ